jgi:carbonic anhydrase/acetyltransferase-like protein (isoleucine patch superfamily)
MKNNLFLFCLVLFASGVFSQTIIKKDSIQSIEIGAVENSNRVIARKMIPIGNPCKNCTVLVIYNQQKSYSKTAKAVIDTLSKKYKYTLHSGRDAISRYTNERNIKKVILIEAVKPKTQ